MYKSKTQFLIIILAILIFQSCKNENIKKENIKAATVKTVSTMETLKLQLNNSNSKNVMVAVHRAGWRYAPENSLQAIQNCIDMGADMVEIDIHKTKDGKLVLMHDKTIDRTTTGKGLVSEWTLDSLKTLYLKSGGNHPTHHKIPTLKQAMLLAKGKILINLDKCYNYFDDAFEIAKKTKTTNQIVMKGYNKTVNQVISDFGNKLDTIIFMPIINLNKQPNALQIIDDYQNKLKVKAFEIVFSKDTSEVLNKFSQIKNNGSRVWVNSLWASLNAGYEDDAAVKNTDSIYGWYIDKGVNMIQTDRPKLLLKYLRSKGLHK